MGFESYISESEASILAGVGITTLRRFAEAGYFKVETESDGLKLYARSDLERVFGLKSKPVTAQPIPQIPVGFQAWTPPAATISPESNGAPGAVEASEEIPPTVDIEIPVEPKVNAAAVMSAPSSPHSVESSIPAAVSAGTSTGTPAVTEPAVEKSIATSAVASQPSAQQPQQLAALEVLDRELHKARTIAEMHDRLLAIREEEIRSLKDEREWLRARIEKLEEKSSRDQVLLLAETQTIKTLISIQEQRRSPVRLALEWLGFVTPPAPAQSIARSAIDITEKEPQPETKKAA